MKTRIFYILLFISIIRLHAQSTNKGGNSLGTWYAVTTSSKVSDKFSIDLNLRPQNLDPEMYYRLAKEFENLRS